MRTLASIVEGLCGFLSLAIGAFAVFLILNTGPRTPPALQSNGDGLVMTILVSLIFGAGLILLAVMTGRKKVPPWVALFAVAAPLILRSMLVSAAPWVTGPGIYTVF